MPGGLYGDFLAHLKDTGVTKTSHFEFFLPSIPQYWGMHSLPGFQEVLRLRCEASELPGRQLVTQDAKIYGPTYKVPYQSLYQEITLTFLETGTLFIRRFFEKWMDQIFNSSTNLSDYPDQWQTECQLLQYDMTGANTSKDRTYGYGLDRIAIWELHNAFPIAINQMPVSWNEDNFHRTTITLAYQWYSIRKVDNPPNAPTNLDGPITDDESNDDIGDIGDG